MGCFHEKCNGGKKGRCVPLASSATCVEVAISHLHYLLVFELQHLGLFAHNKAEICQLKRLAWGPTMATFASSAMGCFSRAEMNQQILQQLLAPRPLPGPQAA